MERRRRSWRNQNFRRHRRAGWGSRWLAIVDNEGPAGHRSQKPTIPLANINTTITTSFTHGEALFFCLNMAMHDQPVFVILFSLFSPSAYVHVRARGIINLSCCGIVCLSLPIRETRHSFACLLGALCNLWAVRPAGSPPAICCFRPREFAFLAFYEWEVHLMLMLSPLWDQ